MEDPDLGPDKRTAAALGGWIVFEDESGQSLRPPRSRTWARRGITPVIRVRGGGTGHVSVAGLACYRPGHRSRLIYRLHTYRGRKGETKAFTWTEYRDLLIAAHRQLPGGVVVLVRDNLNVHLDAELRAFTGAQAWLRVFRLPAYAPDLNQVEGIWSVLKRGVLANLAVASFAHLVRGLRFLLGPRGWVVLCPGPLRRNRGSLHHGGRGGQIEGAAALPQAAAAPARAQTARRSKPDGTAAPATTRFPPGPRTDQTRADLRSDSSRPGRPHSSRRGARPRRGIRPVPDAV